MKIQEAINKIQEAGFKASLWEKHGLQRIYIDFNFKGSSRRGGFIGSDKTELVAQACGGHTAKYQAKLDEIAKMNIEWDRQKKESQTEINEIISNQKRVAVESKKEAETQDWEFWHEL